MQGEPTGAQRKRSRRALLLVDFQEDFLDDGGRMPVARSQVESVIASAQMAIKQAQEDDELIVKIGNEFRRSDFVRNLFRRGSAIEGSSGTRWDSRVEGATALYLKKWKSDAFCNPDLDFTLLSHEVGELSIAGLFAGACITATTKSAIARGYEVQLMVDAIACRSDASRAAAFERLQKRGAKLQHQPA